MVIQLSNEVVANWYGTVRTKSPFTINEDVINGSNNLSHWTKEDISEFEDISVTDYCGHVYKKALEEIKLLISQGRDSKLLITNIEEKVENALNYVPKNYVEVDGYDLEDGEYYWEDFAKKFEGKYVLDCSKEVTTHSLIYFQNYDIVLEGVVESNDSKVIFIQLLK